MSNAHNYELPNFDKLLGALLNRIEQQYKPLLLALLEYVAAKKYREWANATEFKSERDQLLACAQREEEIAQKIEELYPDPKLKQQEIFQTIPELTQASEGLFGEKSTQHQIAVLAAGERWGSDVWKTLADDEGEPEKRKVFLSCRPLEEANAEVLEKLLLSTNQEP